jgi:putative endonuclease
MKNEFYVYIMSSATRVLYIGYTGNLERRVYEHKNKLVEGFTAKYNVSRLVYFEHAPNGRAAVERENQLKGWLRAKKVQLINEMNPAWEDLSKEWFE